ncbi:MAG: hypothetical protein ACOC9B_06945 [Chloroflexota bacterium]
MGPTVNGLAMLTVILAVVLLLALFALTVHWTFSQLRHASDPKSSAQLLTARLWAASTSFLVLLVFLTGTISGLVRSDVRGVERLITGLSWGPVQVALVVCAMLAAVPLGLTARAVAGGEWTAAARAQMVSFVVVLGVVIGLLLSLACAP